MPCCLAREKEKASTYNMSLSRSIARLYQSRILFNPVRRSYQPESTAAIKRSSIKPSPPSNSSSYNCRTSSSTKWIIGSLLAAALPFLGKSCRRLLRLEEEVEMVADAVEGAAEMVEKAAIIVEKVSSDITEQLPENGHLRGTVLLVEKVAKEVAEEAHLAQDIIHKMNEMKDDAEALIGPFLGKE